jgi:hypothetical protein
MNYLATQPVLKLIYRFKQRRYSLLLKKHRSRKQCQPSWHFSSKPWIDYASPDSRHWLPWADCYTIGATKSD